MTILRHSGQCVDRHALSRPFVAVSTRSQVVFVAAAATSLGVISSNAKTFIVLFLSFWYVVINDKGVMCVAIAIVLAIAAQTVYAMRLRAD